MKLRILLFPIILALLLSACGAAIPAQTATNRADAQDAIVTLEDADTITLKKAALAIGDEWDVKINDKLVAEMKGLDIPTLGDTYSLLSPSGGFMAGEDEEIFNLAQKANFYDAEEKTTGVLKKKILTLMAEYTLKNTEGEVTATLKQKFSFGFKATIKDAKGRDAWKVERKVLSVGASITMTRATDTGVSALDAIRMVAVANEVYEAETKN